MDDITLSVGGDTLVLNSDCQPLSMVPVSTITWKDAIRVSYLDQVDVLSVYDDWEVHSPSVSIKVPAVIMTRKWVRMGRAVRFTRANVYLRDHYTCQYCNVEFSASELTWDHVIPKVKGGKTSWDNIVTACSPCNHRKSHYEAMKPKSIARKPTYGEMIANLRQKKISIRHPSWNDYLLWPESNVLIAN